MGNPQSSLLLAPGTKIMQKRRFLHKILILLVIMLIPIIMLTYFLHTEITKVTDFAQGERNGVQYVLPLSEILIELTSGLTPDFGSSQIEEQIKIIEKNDNLFGTELKTTATWHELKELLQKHNPGTRQIAIDKTLGLISKVGDNSGLVLDPDMDSYYIMDAAIVKYPDILSKTNQISSFAMEGVGRPIRTVDDQIKMAMVVGAVRSTLHGVKTGVETAAKANTSLQVSVQAYGDSEVATVNLLKQVDSNLMKSNGVLPLANGPEILNQLQQTNGKNAVAYRLYLKQLDELLTKRMNTVIAHEMNIFIGIIISFIIASYFLVVLYGSMKKSIMDIFAGTQNFAVGDWREEIKVSSVDEFADIGMALNQVREKMRPMIGEILNSAQQVATASEELTASSEQVAQSANYVCSSVSQVANGAEQQLLSVNRSILAIEKMSLSIRQVAANTSQATHSSEKTAEAARKGTVSVTTAIQQMKSIESAVLDSAGVVRNLGERSQEIGQIVDTISAIAQQTNLLALNAAIEAARAGEQGRGFAVVAEEVRKLAEQSQEATKQIASLITEIQNQTGKAVSAMQLGTKVVETGTEVVNTAGEAFSEIVELIYQVSGQIHEISTNLQQIASGNQEVVTTANEIAITSRKAVDETQGVSAVSQEQSASMEEIASSSQALSKLAEKLQHVVTFFKV